MGHEISQEVISDLVPLDTQGLAAKAAVVQSVTTLGCQLERSANY